MYKVNKRYASNKKSGLCNVKGMNVYEKSISDCLADSIRPVIIRATIHRFIRRLFGSDSPWKCSGGFCARNRFYRIPVLQRFRVFSRRQRSVLVNVTGGPRLHFVSAG